MAASKTIAQKANALFSLYCELYLDKYGFAPSANRYRDRWGFQDMITDLGYERSQEVVRFYLTTGRVTHTIIDLFRNYDRLNEIMTELANDEAKRAELREATRRKVMEWEQKYGNS